MVTMTTTNSLVGPPCTPSSCEPKLHTLAPGNPMMMTMMMMMMMTMMMTIMMMITRMIKMKTIFGHNSENIMIISE